MFSMLYQRIITSIIAIPLIIACVFYLPPLAFIALVAAIIAVAAWEMSGLFWPGSILYRCFFLALLLLLFILGELFSIALPILLLGGIWWLCVPYFLTRYAQNRKIDFTRLPIGFLTGILTFIPCAISLTTLRFDFGAKYLLFLLIIVWIADMGAYFTGRFCGKRLLAEKISPQKTVEGLFGGLLVALLAAIPIGFIAHLRSNVWPVWLLFIVVVILWSVFGDLFESMLKRSVGVKDSGHLLPGHGGMYDRIDSLTSAAPIFTLGMLLLRL